MAKRRAWKVGLLLAISTLIWAPASFGHTTLVSSTPAKGSVITEWPTEVSLEFAENLQTFSAGDANFIEVLDLAGNRVNATVATVTGAKLTTAMLKMAEFGIVTVKYRVVAEDGHVLEDSFNFTFDPARAVVTAEESAKPVSTSNYRGLGIAAVLIIAILFFGVVIYRKNSKEN